MESAPLPTAGQYDEIYFQRHCGDQPYQRDQLWLGHFGRVADRIVADVQPASMLDVGCAWGFLVEALRDRGVEAYGIDVSEYALAQAREDIRPFLGLGGAGDPLLREFDLITCIEVLEHLPPAEAETAIANFCSHTDDIIFSSTADDFTEASHVNVRPPEHWAEIFARQGFIRDVDYEATYISGAAVRFRRSHEPLPRVVRDYERTTSRLIRENQAVRAAGSAHELRLAEKERDLGLAEARADALQVELDDLKRSIPVRLTAPAVRAVNKTFPAESRRGQRLRRALRAVLK